LVAVIDALRPVADGLTAELQVCGPYVLSVVKRRTPQYIVVIMQALGEDFKDPAPLSVVLKVKGITG
jgi:hypothetical protein